MPDSILVTGAAGFAGGHLLDLLTSRPSHGPVIGWHVPGRPPRRHHAGVEWRGVDLLDRPSVLDAIAAVRPGVVYHCAGAASVGAAWNRVEETFGVNVRGTHHLLSALAEAGTVTRVLIPSSSLVYRPSDRPLTEDHPIAPATPYGVSKLAQELIGLDAASDRLAVFVARAFTHIGPGQDAEFSVSNFARQIADIEAGRQAVLHVGNLDPKRDITDVRDTVRAYEAIVERGTPGRPYNICSGTAVSIRSMLEMLVARARVPMPEPLVDPALLRPVDSPLVVGDRSRAASELRWEPRVPLAQTLDDLLEDWRRRAARPTV